MRTREVSLSGRFPARRLRISQPGRAVPPIEFEGPEVELMLRSGCIGVLLDESRTCRLDGQQVARIVSAVAAARLLLRQLRANSAPA